MGSIEAVMPASTAGMLRLLFAVGTAIAGSATLVVDSVVAGALLVALAQPLPLPLDVASGGLAVDGRNFLLIILLIIRPLSKSVDANERLPSACATL